MMVRDTVARVTVSQPVKPRVRRAQRRTRKAGSDTQAVTVDPRVMAVALRLAGGDKRRLVIEWDGSVTVRNQRRGL